MTYAALVRARRMTRRFASEPAVPREVLAGLLDLAAFAPSAGHTQGAEYLVLSSADEVATFWEAATPSSAESASPARRAWLAGVREAPVLIFCLADEGAYRQRYAAPDKGGRAPDAQDWPVPYWLTDVAMGAMILLLGAQDAGLGALFFGVPGESQSGVKAAFGIPPDRVIVGIIALGTPASRHRSRSLDRPRRRGADITHWGRFGAPRERADPPSARMPGRP
ncbi:MAG: nitroreductase family protein [Tetrasphaera jenkinsii]|jgi:nitroreductase|nr:nitroreductase family protein [Tetrasphaera jenkinsii]